LEKKKTNKIQKEKYLGQAPLHFHLKVAQQVGPDRLDLIFFKKIRSDFFKVSQQVGPDLCDMILYMYMLYYMYMLWCITNTFDIC